MTLKRAALWIVGGFLVLTLAGLIFSTSWAWFPG
jgi:hypothetical protein